MELYPSQDTLHWDNMLSNYSMFLQYLSFDSSFFAIATSFYLGHYAFIQQSIRRKRDVHLLHYNTNTVSTVFLIIKFILHHGASRRLDKCGIQSFSSIRPKCNSFESSSHSESYTTAAITGYIFARRLLDRHCFQEFIVLHKFGHRGLLSAFIN